MLHKQCFLVYLVKAGIDRLSVINVRLWKNHGGTD